MGYLARSISRGIWPIFFGLGFIAWGIIGVIRPNVPGSYWMFIPGGILLIAGFSDVFNYRYNREKVISTLKSYTKINMHQLTDELKMKEKDIKELIIDLRTEGELKASFDPKSGDVIVLEVRGQPPVGATFALPTKTSTNDNYTLSLKNIKDSGYCPYCGSKIQATDKYCITCGSAID